MNKKIAIISRASIEKAVKTSLKLEGISLARAKKDTTVINLLKKHGRAFSV